MPSKTMGLMGLMDLPLEILRTVLTEAVRSRGLKRALRLRLVNKFFSDELPEALCATNVIDDCWVKLEKWPWIRPYIEKRLLERRTHRLSRLDRIRRTAEILESQDEPQTTYREIALQLLHLASTAGRQNVRLLLLRRPETCTEQRFQYDVMCAAAFTNNYSLVKSILGSDFTTSYHIYLDPFKAAMLGRRYDILTLLLTTNPTKLRHFWDIKGRIRLLCTASEMGDAQMVQFILQPAYNPLVGWSPSTHSEYTGRYGAKKRAIQFLRTPNVEVFNIIRNELESRKITSVDKEWLLSECLYYAICRGWGDMTRHLVGLGLPLDVPIKGREIKENPLYWACKWGYTDVVNVLFDAGAQICGSELSIALSCGHISIVKILLEKGADVCSAFLNDTRYTTARRGDLGIIKVLLDAGMDLSIGDSSTRLLVGAVQSEHEGMFRLLVQRGAIVTRALPKATKIAEAENLDSMLALLGEYRTTEHAGQLP